MIALAPIRDGQLWQWKATDQFGKSVTYQAHGPSCTESHMLQYLRDTFRNVQITNIERLEDGQYKPATGMIESHVFEYGHMRKAQAEILGHDAHPDKPLLNRMLIPRRQIVRAAIPRT